MPTPVTIRLTPAELKLAAQMGCMRQISNLYKDRRDAYGCPLTIGWQVHIEGCAGELAVAKHLNLFWNGNFENLNADDVGRFQVRTADSHNRRLILHDKDQDDRIFILVTGMSPSFLIQGWIRAADGKQSRYWTDPAGGRPAYFVPKGDLNPMSEIPGVVG